MLYNVVEKHAEAFLARVGEEGASLPAFVHEEFVRYLRCGRLEEGFVRVVCTGCRHEHLVAFSCECRGFCPSCGARQAASIRYRIATGPIAGRKTLRLHSPGVARESPARAKPFTVARGGFSLNEVVSTGVCAARSRPHGPGFRQPVWNAGRTWHGAPGSGFVVQGLSFEVLRERSGHTPGRP